MLNKPIIIGDWKKGMTLSPYSGFPQMRGIDPHKIDGVASIERAPVALTTSGTATSQINWIITNNSGVVYWVDSTGKLFKTTDFATYSQVQGTGYNGTTESTNAHGNGLVYWKGFILRVRDNVVDAYKISTTTWTYGFITFTNIRVGFNPAFVGQDDIVYFGNGKLVASLQEVGTFDPTNSATWTFTAAALTLPQDYAVNCFAELGDKLMIGTIYGSSPVNTKISDIFPWDRNTANSFSLPIRLADEGINSMLNSNNVLYISSGFKGNIYVSNGVSVSLLSSIPLDIKEKTGSPSSLYLQVYPDAFDFFGDELLIGVSQGSSGATKTENPMGVYGFLKGTMRFLGNQTSAKDGSDGTRIVITSIYSVSPNEYFVAWVAGTSYGIDYLGPPNNKVASYGAYCISEIFSVGSERQQATLEFFDFYLAKPLVSGDGIRLSYRTSNSGNFITITTFDYATYGAVDSFSFTRSIPNIKNVQFKIEMTATSTTTPELRMIIIT